MHLMGSGVFYTCEPLVTSTPIGHMCVQGVLRNTECESNKKDWVALAPVPSPVGLRESFHLICVTLPPNRVVWLDGLDNEDKAPWPTVPSCAKVQPEGGWDGSNSRSKLGVVCSPLGLTLVVIE